MNMQEAEAEMARRKQVQLIEQRMAEARDVFKHWLQYTYIDRAIKTYMLVVLGDAYSRYWAHKISALIID